VTGESDYHNHNVTVVVAERTDETVTLGLPASEFADVFQIIHLPPLGSVDADTLSWHVMYDRFQPLVFPVERGQEWTTQFHGAELDAEVTGAGNGTVTVTMTGPNERAERTYDAVVGMVTNFEPEGYGTSFEVTDHGFGYEGPVKAPTNKALGFLTGRAAGAVGAGLEPAAPVETVEIDREAAHASLALLAGSLTPTGDNAGAYRAAVTAPDDTTSEQTWTPTPQASQPQPAFFHHDTVQGTWQLEMEAGGPGYVLAGLITYDVTEVTLGADSTAPQQATR
jgi:hypothetical protein